MWEITQVALQSRKIACVRGKYKNEWVFGKKRCPRIAFLALSSVWWAQVPCDTARCRESCWWAPRCHASTTGATGLSALDPEESVYPQRTDVSLSSWGALGPHHPREGTGLAASSSINTGCAGPTLTSPPVVCLSWTNCLTHATEKGLPSASCGTLWQMNISHFFTNKS